MRPPIEVEDLERAIDFYTPGLGLKLCRPREPNWVELEGANLPIFLPSDRPSVADLGGTHVPRSFARHWAPVDLDFLTRNLDAALHQACQAGALIDREIQVRDWGRMANLADPFGNGFDLIEIRGGGYGSETSKI